MIIIKDLSIFELNKSRKLVDSLSCVINDGEKVAIIGQEGVGKTTFLNAINNDNSEYVEVTGSIKVIGSLGYLKQKLEVKYYKNTIEEYLIDGNFENYEYFQIALELLSKFNIDISDSERKLETYSGGEKMKIMLARVLMSNPSNILMDEPSNDLDLETIIFLENLILSLDACVVFVSHDIKLLENVSTGVIHLALVKKRTTAQSSFYRLNYQEFYDQYLRKYERETMIAKKERADMKKKQDRFRRIFQKVEFDQNQAVRDPGQGRKLKVKMHALKSQEHRYEKEIASFHEFPVIEEPIRIFFVDQDINPTKVMVSFDNEELKLDDKVLIEKMNFEIRGSDRIAIIGKNGCGKTTLIKRMIIKLEEKQIPFGYISQNYEEILNYNDNVIAFLSLNQTMYDVSQIRKILGGLGFNTMEMEQTIENLSEGQKLKVLLLLLISKRSEVLLLDEPTRNLSPINQKEIINLFNAYKGAIVLISHDRNFLEEVCDEVLLIENKCILKVE